MVGLMPIGRSKDSGDELVAFFWSLRQQDYADWRAAGHVEELFHAADLQGAAKKTDAIKPETFCGFIL